LEELDLEPYRAVLVDTVMSQAEDIFAVADRWALRGGVEADGELSMTELKQFLPGTTHYPFLHWLMKEDHMNFRSFDSNKTASLSLAEVYNALDVFRAENNAGKSSQALLKDWVKLEAHVRKKLSLGEVEEGSSLVALPVGSGGLFLERLTQLELQNTALVSRHWRRAARHCPTRVLVQGAMLHQQRALEWGISGELTRVILAGDGCQGLLPDVARDILLGAKKKMDWVEAVEVKAVELKNGRGNMPGRILTRNVRTSKIHVSGGCIGDEGLSYVAKGLTPNLILRKQGISTPLRYLALPYSRIGRGGGKHACGIITNCLTLEVLDLSMNRLGEEGGVSMFKGPHPPDGYNLTRLNLMGNALGLRGGDALGAALSHMPMLRALELEGCALVYSDQEAFFDPIRVHPSLEVLDLKQNMYGEEAMKFLSLALIGNRRIRVLDVGGNRMGDRGAAYLGEGIAKNLSLEILRIEGAFLGGNGTISVAGGLGCRSTKIRELNMRGNGMGFRGGMAIGEMIGRNETLTALSVARNSLGEESISAIAKGIRVNSHMLFLDIQSNAMGSRLGKEIALAFQLNENTALREIDVRGNGCEQQKQHLGLLLRAAEQRGIEVLTPGNQYCSTDIHDTHWGPKKKHLKHVPASVRNIADGYNPHGQMYLTKLDNKHALNHGGD